jgi:hypothetical protein
MHMQLTPKMVTLQMAIPNAPKLVKMQKCKCNWHLKWLQ